MAVSQQEKRVLAGKGGSYGRSGTEEHAELTALESNEINTLLTKGITIRPIGR